MELVEEIAGAFRELQVRWALLSGGEAMQHPHWPEIAQRFRAEGVYVMLLTNGLLLRKQVHDVVEAVDEVIVSLDGGNASTYQAIRGVDAFDLIIDGIRSVRQHGIPVSTRTTVQRANFREMPQIIEVAREAGVNRVSFLTVDVSNAYAFGPRFFADLSLKLINQARPAETALSPSEVPELAAVIEDVIARFADAFHSGLVSEPPDKLRRMVDYFGAINGDRAFPRPRCNSPHISTVIEVDGTLRPCYFLPAYGKLSVNSTDNAQSRDSVAHNLKDAINLPTALALRRAYRTGLRHECERCVCPLYKGPRALMRM
jgi:MoaA/NifB/PqqE/SkfB family radical SAM enzyme